MRVYDPVAEGLPWCPRRRKNLLHAESVLTIWTPEAEHDAGVRADWRTIVDQGRAFPPDGESGRGAP